MVSVILSPFYKGFYILSKDHNLAIIGILFNIPVLNLFMLSCDFKDKIDREEGHRYPPLNNQPKPAKGWYILGFLVAGIILFSATLLIGGEGQQSWANIPFLGRLLGGDKALQGENEDRINILLLGMGGKNHDGGLLTDTIILASLKPSTQEGVLLSLPRDMAVPTQNGNWQKVNSINAYAESRKENGSQVLADNLSNLLEVPINYYVRVDFDGFVKMIDDIGGIDIEVDNTLDDYQYPIRGEEDNPSYNARYEHLHIDKGWQHMDGTLALKYVRSRHGINGEGSDFARSRRQQKVISAVKEKLLKSENLLKPGMIARVIADLNQNISTNLGVWEIARLWNLFKDINQDKIVNKVLDDGPTNYLSATIGVDGAYLLVPKTGNFSAIRAFVQTLMAPAQKTDNNTEAKTEENKLSSANLSNVNFVAPALVEIKNGTTIKGLATQVANEMKEANFSVTRISNASQQDFIQTVIFDLTYGAKPEALKGLQKLTKAKIEKTLPDWLTQEIKDSVKADPSQRRPDFIVILGSDNQ